MKKVLFSTTALVLSAGVASAAAHTDGVSVGGKAGIWLQGNESANGTDDVQVNYDLNIEFSATGQTDTGLEFGLNFLIIDDTDNNSADDADKDDSPGSEGFQLDDSEVYVSGAFGKITVGDVDDALQKVAGLADIGYDGIGLDNVAEVGRGIGTSNGVLYENTVGPVTVYLSHARDLGKDDYSVGVSFTTGDFTIGLGYEDTDGNGTSVVDGVTAVDFAGSFGQVGFDIFYIDHDLGEHYGTIVSFDAGDVTVDVGYADGETASDAAIGVGFAYDLGGAELAGGVGDVGGDTVWDLGVSMEF